MQFYSNYCGINNWNTSTSSNFNFDSWDDFASTSSYNSNVKVYLGIPASQDAAGTGYVHIATLNVAAADIIDTYPSFGGIAMW